MATKFKVEATYNDEEFHIKLDVATIEAKDQEQAEAYAKQMKLGKVFYKRGFTFLFRETSNGVSVILNTDVNSCEMSKLENVKQEITFNDLLKGLYNEALKKSKYHIYFEGISVQVSPI